MRNKPNQQKTKNHSNFIIFAHLLEHFYIIEYERQYFNVIVIRYCDGWMLAATNTIEISHRNHFQILYVY